MKTLKTILLAAALFTISACNGGGGGNAGSTGGPTGYYVPESAAQVVMDISNQSVGCNALDDYIFEVSTYENNRVRACFVMPGSPMTCQDVGSISGNQIVFQENGATAVMTLQSDDNWQSMLIANVSLDGRDITQEVHEQSGGLEPMVKISASDFSNLDTFTMNCAQSSQGSSNIMSPAPESWDFE